MHKKKIPTASEFDYKKTIKLLESAKSPLVLLGGGALEANDVILKFVEKTGVFMCINRKKLMELIESLKARKSVEE